MSDLVLNANSSPANATWTSSGTTPYIDATDASYVTTSTKNVLTEVFTFEESSDLGTITSVIFSIRAMSDDGKGDITIEYSPDGGSSFPASDAHINFTSAYETRDSVELVTTFDTWAKINLAAARFQGKASSTYQVDHVYMTVVYTPGAAETPQAVGGHAMAIAGVSTPVPTFIEAVGGYAIVITGSLLKMTSKTVGEHAMIITQSLVKKGFKDVGGHVMTIIGALATATIFLQAVGGYAIAIAGSLLKMTSKAVGGYAITMAGVLGTVTTYVRAVGGYAVSIIGTLIRQGYKAVGGHSMTISGTLASATIFLQSVGGYALTAIGSLSKMTQKTIGGALLSITGALKKKTSKYFGGSALSSAGGVSTSITIGQSAGDGIVSPQGSLSHIITYVVEVGKGALTILGSLLKTKIPSTVGAFILRGLEKLGMNLR